MQIYKQIHKISEFLDFRIPIYIYIYRSDPIRPLQFVAANIGDSFTSEGYLKMMGKIAFPA